MAEDKVRLTFEKGILESQEDSLIEPGWLAACENWVPEPSGALRARVGLKNGITTGAPTTRKVKGIGTFAASRPYATPARVRKRTDTDSTNTVASNFATNGTAGNIYIAFVHGVAVTGDVTTFTTPAGWLKVAEQIDNTDTNGNGIALFYKTSIASTTGATFAFTDTGVSQQISVDLIEYSGLHATEPLEESATNNGVTTDATQTGMVMDSGTTQPLSQSSGLFVAGFAGNQAAVTWSSPTETFTQVDEVLDTGNVEMSTYERFAETATSAHMKVTTDVTQNHWVAIVAVFKAKTQTTSSTDKYLVANADSGTQFTIYAKDRASLTTGAWSSVEAISGLSDTTYPVCFAAGMGQVLYTNPSFSTTRRWNGTTAGAITGAPAGRAVTFFRGRFYIAQGTKLYYSKLNDPFVWDLNDYEEFGEDDGFDIEDVQPMEDGLVIAKQNSLWFLAGTGPDNYQKDGPIKGNGFRGRSVCVTPFGAIVAGEKRLYLYNGSVDEISKPIETSYAFTGSWVTTAYSDDVVYILDSGSQTTFRFDIRRSAWSLEKLSSSNEGPQTIYSDNDRLLYGPKSATTIGLLAYKTFPGARAKDEGMGATAQGDLIITPIYNGTDSSNPQTITAEASAGVYRKKVTVADDDHKGADAVQFRFSQSGAEVFTATTPEMWRHGPDNSITPEYLYLQVRQRGTGDDVLFDIEHAIFAYHRADRA